MNIMLFYITLIPVLILSLRMIVKLLRIKKHDDVLFQFCQLRRDMMKYMRNKAFNIPEKDYKDLKRLLNLVNDTIHHYDDHKTGLFRIGNYPGKAKMVYKSVREAKKKQSKHNAKVKSFYREYGKIMLSAFFAYSPFLRSKVIIFLLIKLIGLVTKLTGHHFNKYLHRKASFLQWLRGEKQKYNLDLT